MSQGEAASWLATAVEAATVGWPEPLREQIPINCTVPAVGPQRAHEITARSGCGTVKVKVADHPESLAQDLARVEAVRDALGPGGAIRVDANGAWDVDTAVRAIGLLDRAAGRLEYVEQPCRSIEDLAAVHAASRSGSPLTSRSAAPRIRCGSQSRARLTSRCSSAHR